MDLSQPIAAVLAAVLTLLPQPAEAKSSWLHTGQMPTDSEVIQKTQAEDAARMAGEAALPFVDERSTIVGPQLPTPNETAPLVESVPDQIRQTFGADAPTALRVFWCESRFQPLASNGQFKGVAQMGSRERATYGHGPDAAAQIAAAYRYFQESGWRPWRACV